ncbi:MAG: hypothetical protein INH43_11655 [Acidobacteriaceae bacterium]|nr:hypothetical protein [Acidobacteriaceae bacterium]
MKAVALVLALTALVGGQGFDWDGTYASREMRLQLRRGAAGTFAGTIEIKGQQLPVQATAAAGRLEGTFTAGGQRFPFTVTGAGAQLRLVSEGHEYLLAREAAAPAGGAAHRHASGFSVVPPAGWTAADKDQAILLQPPDGVADEVYMALVQEGYNAAEESAAVRQLSEMFLAKAANVRRSGDREAIPGGAAYHWEVVHPETRQMAGLSIYVAPQGSRAHLVVAAGPVDRVRARQPLLGPVVQSIRYAAPPAGATSPLTRQWEQKLRGKVVRQFWASQGMSSDKRHYLNADGTYAFESSSMVSVDVAGASGGSYGKDDRRGRWSIVERGGAPYLQILYNSGESRLLAITADATNWYLNGEKAFAVER